MATTPQIDPKQLTRDEILSIFQAARDAVKRANPQNRDLLAELIAERRAAATRE